jgi:acetylornithine deacetylase
MIYSKAIGILEKLISTPSYSKDEAGAATIVFDYLQGNGMEPKRHMNNVWAAHKGNKAGKPSILLDSHLDTVKAGTGWSIDPFLPIQDGGKLYGLGSNDAGAGLVALLMAFEYFKQKELGFNLFFSATAEEEISGSNGITSILPMIGEIDLAIVGEPTNMSVAVAERGLIVLDCCVAGKLGHVANSTGINAIYEALPVIAWFRDFKFPKVSEFLGEVKMTVSQIKAGIHHNQVPDLCQFVVDVRTNGLYSNTEVVEIIQSSLSCQIKPRSLRLESSSISLAHPVVATAKKLGLELFGSPTTSNMAVIPFPSVKLGPGCSSRSHVADEFIYIDEIRSGIHIYIQMLEDLDFRIGKENEGLFKMPDNHGTQYQ